MIRKYRVWFEAYYQNSSVRIDKLTDEGVVVEAYTADDAITQAKIDIPYMIRNHVAFPFERITIIKIAPDPTSKGD